MGLRSQLFGLLLLHRRRLRLGTGASLAWGGRRRVLAMLRWRVLAGRLWMLSVIV